MLTVDSPQGQPPLPTLQLYSQEAAAGEGRPLHGYSGAPVVIAGHVVGLLVEIAKGEEQTKTAEGGTVYARPIGLVAQALGLELPDLPSRRVDRDQRRVEVFEDARYTQPYFVGRTELLAKLEQHVLAPEPSVVALVGMPGVGKSFLADQFAQTHREVFTGGVLRVLLEARERRSEEVLRRELADRVQLGAGERLAERLRELRVMVHVENADDQASASAARKLVKHLRGVAVVVTGRSQELGRRHGWEHLEVGVLELDDEGKVADILHARGWPKRSPTPGDSVYPKPGRSRTSSESAAGIPTGPRFADPQYQVAETGGIVLARKYWASSRCRL